MKSYKVELSTQVKALAKQVPLQEDYLVELTGAMLQKADELGYDLGGDIVVGIDVNGPIVACGDNNLEPFQGAVPCMEHMMNTPGMDVTLMTGWDLSTMTFFTHNKLNLPKMGIVGEYGMVFERAGEVTYIYPYKEEERLHFIHSAFTLAADLDVKIAFQGNYSPGAGALCVEADEHGDLLQHPLVKGRRPSIEQLFDVVKKKTDAVLNNSKIYFENRKENLKGFAEAFFKVHPLISVRLANEVDGRLSMWIDPKDKSDFSYEKIKEFAVIAEKVVGRKSIAYEDHGVDFFSKEVEEGKYSKDGGLREFGRSAFKHDNFISAVVGDKRTDVPCSTVKTIMFPQKDSEAEEIAKKTNIPHVPVIDIRDCALALSEAHRIKKECK